MNLPNRDSLFWSISILGSICVGLSSAFNTFPWIPINAQHVISLLAFVYGIISAKLATSPLKGA